MVKKRDVCRWKSFSGVFLRRTNDQSENWSNQVVKGTPDCVGHRLPICRFSIRFTANLPRWVGERVGKHPPKLLSTPNRPVSVDRNICRSVLNRRTTGPYNPLDNYLFLCVILFSYCKNKTSLLGKLCTMFLTCWSVKMKDWFILCKTLKRLLT